MKTKKRKLTKIWLLYSFSKEARKYILTNSFTVGSEAELYLARLNDKRAYIIQQYLPVVFPEDADQELLTKRQLTYTEEAARGEKIEKIVSILMGTLILVGILMAVILVLTKGKL